MKQSPTLYVGPVAVFDKIPETFGSDSFDATYCENEKCIKFDVEVLQSKYCQHCGHAVIKRTEESRYTNGSHELLQNTDFSDKFFLIGQDDYFRTTDPGPGFISEVVVVGAREDDKLSDTVGEIGVYSDVIFCYTIEEMVDSMRRFADKYSAELDTFIPVLGQYKLVWSANISN